MAKLICESKIISNSNLAKGYYLLTLDVPSYFKDASPGQFIHIKISETVDPLLRRPFSIHKVTPVKTKSSIKKCLLEVLYETKGRGTELLAKQQPGQHLSILGPLGNGFSHKDRQGLSLLVAGGMGIAPLSFLAEKLLPSKTIILIGSATASKILCENKLKKIGCEVLVATEDGSKGFKGKVTDLLEKKTIADFKNKKNKHSQEEAVQIYACGPTAMLTKLAKICLMNKLELQVSLEEFMGCGIGACLGCAIATKSGYQRVCKDGPVFNYQDVLWSF